MKRNNKHSRNRKLSISRRDFLTGTAAAAAGLLAGCGPTEQPTATPPEPTAPPTATPTPPLASNYWPTRGWRTSTPEAQGMDSGTLVRMLQYIKNQHIDIRSMVIVRNGYVVAEVYYHPFLPDVKNLLASATKSFTSALVGIAVEQDYIKGVDESVLDLFSDRTVANVDSRKEAITLRHLLTMSSGLDWEDADVGQMFSSENCCTQYVLDKPMAHDPGDQWNYNEGGSHVLSVLIQERSGMSTLDFARTYLFEPLGITDVVWNPAPDGIAYGGHFLYLTPHDMAKFGYLYLNGGLWDGQQVVSADWVSASAQPWMRSDWGADYGYQWWVDPSGRYYFASGYGEQRIFVVPDKKLVVVFTADITPEERDDATGSLLDGFIIPAAMSSSPLPENPEAVATLQSLSDAAAHPEPKPVPPLPGLTQSISGRTYVFEDNPDG